MLSSLKFLPVIFMSVIHLIVPYLWIKVNVDRFCDLHSCIYYEVLTSYLANNNGCLLHASGCFLFF